MTTNSKLSPIQYAKMLVLDMLRKQDLEYIALDGYVYYKDGAVSEGTALGVQEINDSLKPFAYIGQAYGNRYTIAKNRRGSDTAIDVHMYAKANDSAVLSYCADNVILESERLRAPGVSFYGAGYQEIIDTTTPVRLVHGILSFDVRIY